MNKVLVSCLMPVVNVAVAHARLGETEAEMVKRFGAPAMRSKHSTFAQGKSLEMGPTLYFRQDDWSIGCDLVDGRCVRIAYSKPGEWTTEQISLVLAYNSQGASWSETGKPGTASFARSWKRADGATAEWKRGSGMQMVVPAYERAKKTVEAKAKAAASAKPKI